MIVALACMYRNGCSETANAFYSSELELQRSIQYTEQILHKYLTEKQILFGGAAAGALSGNDFTFSVTSNLIMKGNAKWHQLSFSYSWPL